MKRSNHTFQFSAEAIQKAAETEAHYHADRAVWWLIEQKKAIEKAKEAGIEVREHEVTGGINVEVVVDTSITRRLSECASKIREHQEAYDRFQIEAATYATQEGTVYDLDPDDIVYFRLVGGARSE